MSSAAFRPDRAIVQRQIHEAKYERMVQDNLEAYNMEQKAVWENKTADTISTDGI